MRAFSTHASLSNKNCVEYLLYEIADLTFLTWVISQKCSEIADFKILKRLFVTNIGGVMSVGAPSSGARRGPEANEATGMSEENVSKNLKTLAILKNIFVTITKVKKVNVRELI